jgi:isopenicillin N synthase-like dioxygenase
MAVSLPIIDISEIRTSATNSSEYLVAAKDLFQAFSDIGFAIVTGHGVAARTVTNMRTAVRELFATPREVLLADMVEKGNYRGFVPLGYFTPNSGKGTADQYEAWKLHNETDPNDPICSQSPLYGTNKWPAISFDVKTPVMTYWNALEGVTNDIVIALCSALQIDASFVMSCMTQGLTNMTLLNYPPMAADVDGWGIHPHKDFNVITALAHDPIGGLEVRARSGDWLDATCPEDAFVLNVGDMLELWSGGRLISTPHRVVNRTGEARQSFPFFAKPRYDVIIEPLITPIDGFDRLPLHVGTSAADIWYSNWPDAASTDPAQELGSYQ